MKRLELLEHIDAGHVIVWRSQNAAILKVPGRVIEIVTHPVYDAVEAGLVEPTYAALEQDRIPLILTEAGERELELLRREAGLARNREKVSA